MTGGQESERTRRHLVSAVATQSENSSVHVSRPPLLPPIHYVSRFILRGEHGHPGDTEPRRLQFEEDVDVPLQASCGGL